MFLSKKKVYLNKTCFTQSDAAYYAQDFLYMYDHSLLLGIYF